MDSGDYKNEHKRITHKSKYATFKNTDNEQFEESSKTCTERKCGTKKGIKVFDGNHCEYGTKETTIE